MGKRQRKRLREFSKPEDLVKPETLARIEASLDDSILRAIDTIRNQKWEPCRHIVSPRALAKPGYYRCVNCGAVVHIPRPLREPEPIVPDEDFLPTVTDIRNGRFTAGYDTAR